MPFPYYVLMHTFSIEIPFPLSLHQAPCQAELDTWVNSIHSACAAAFARHRGKTGTLHLLQEEILRLERSIESVCSTRHATILPRLFPADRLRQ